MRRSMLVMMALAWLAHAQQTCADIGLATDKCAFARQYCAEEQISAINYMEAYYCASSKASSVFVIMGCVVWLICLFLSIGIAASDYLCPNLHTMSTILGMSESLVGVTFLALGNGSPDLFSTYAAMRIGAGSLAIGELLGAASFILAVVTGSMALARPFKVTRKTYLRDSVFFLVAMLFTIFFVSDGVLWVWECVVMLTLYTIYVIFVVSWHWIRSRQRKRYVQDMLARDFYTEPGYEQQLEADEEIADSHPLLQSPTAAGAPTFSGHEFHDEPDEPDEEAYRDIVNLMGFHSNRNPRSSHLSLPDHLHYAHGGASPRSPRSGMHSGESTPESRGRKRGRPHSPFSPRGRSSNSSASPKPSIRPSLYSALEFRALMNQLREARHASGRYYDDDTIAMNSRSSLSPPPSATAAAEAEGTSDREAGPRKLLPRLYVTDFGRYVDQEPVPHDIENRGRSLSPPNVEEEEDPELVEEMMNERLFGRIAETSKNSIFTLLPALNGLFSKPYYAIISSILTTPTLFLLSITIPVHQTEDASEDDKAQAYESSSPAPSLGPTPLPKSDLMQNPRWLLILQAVVAPFVVAITQFYMDGTVYLTTAILGASVGTLTLLALLFLCWSSPDSAPGPQIKLVSFIGFFVAISWISTIANEVVGVLKMFGAISNVSDAILGLTVFALGNSLGDLVSNVTVARMGYPMMAVSACFGGPLLNILAGVGLSCLVVLLRSGRDRGYHIELSPSLVVSTSSLIITLLILIIAVPLNNWRISRTIGVATIACWAVSIIINIIIEFI
uniref:ARAD1D46904p n=1 Tax=Blastobotrys adeninivorans TaxID=409370 RepID=A0A060TJI0_BLAAD